MVDVLMRHAVGWRKALLLEAVRRWMPSAPVRASIADQLERLLTAQPGKRLVVAGAVVWRDRHAIVFVDRKVSGDPVSGDRESGGPFSLELIPGGPLDVGIGTILMEAAPKEDLHLLRPGKLGYKKTSFSTDPNTELVDGRILGTGISVQSWHEGDRFQPIGMTGHKSVSNFLTDEKVDPHLKSRTLVVKCGEEIVWVVGHRLAHPFRVRSDSESVVRLSFIPKRRVQRAT